MENLENDFIAIFFRDLLKKLEKSDIGNFNHQVQVVSFAYIYVILLI